MLFKPCEYFFFLVGVSPPLMFALLFRQYMQLHWIINKQTPFTQPYQTQYIIHQPCCFYNSWNHLLETLSMSPPLSVPNWERSKFDDDQHEQLCWLFSSDILLPFLFCADLSTICNGFSTMNRSYIGSFKLCIGRVCGNHGIERTGEGEKTLKERS